MKKIFVLFLSLAFVSPAFAEGDLRSWVSDVVANNGHVTYTLNAYIPVQNDTIYSKNRRDFVCSQRTEAILWGEMTSISTGQTIDYTSFMDKSKLRKYAPIKPVDYEYIQQIIPYCNK